MKILYLCPDLGIPVLGRKGASAHVRELVGALNRAGHRVTLAAQTLLKTPGEEPAKINARIIHVQPDPTATAATQALKDFNERLALENSLPGELRRLLYNQALYRELKRRFLKHKPDFIYERASLYATAGVRLAKRFNVPHIVELNAPLAVEQAAYRATGFGELAAQAERWTLMQADAVVVVSNELRNHVRALGVPTRKIHVMPNGVNPELFFPNPSKHQLSSSSSSFSSSSSALPRISRTRTRTNESCTLGFVGGLRPWHGVEVLPELLARLSKRQPKLRLIIAGDGQLRDELERGFRKRGLTRRVTFAGALLHEQVPDVIRRFDIALAPYPKHDHEFYFSPLKLFEYMACGVAVVAAKQGQVAEVVRHGLTGLLYPPGNLAALATNCERLLADADLRSKLGAAAAKLVHEKFTWNHNAARVVDLARVLASGRKRRQ